MRPTGAEFLRSSPRPPPLQTKKRHRPWYWNQLQLLAHGQVVEINVQALLAQLFKPSQAIGGAEAGKCQEVADSVGLIKIPRSARKHLGENMHPKSIQLGGSCDACPPIQGIPIRSKP